MDQPLVSCIMPTANRQKYIPLAIQNFLEQDYPNKELVIIDDGAISILPLLADDPQIKYFYSDSPKTVGMKRNEAGEKASGEIIMHWDDDDWRAADWITKQLHFLLNSGADICGIEHVNFYAVVTDTLWQGTSLNRNNPHYRGWLNGATLAYRKSFWRQHPFKDLNSGEDDDFISSPEAILFAHDYIDGFIAVLHPKNTTVKYFENPAHKRI